MTFIKISISVLLLLFANIAEAQYSISAKVKDDITSEPLVYCSVALMQKDSAISFAITDQHGYFEIPAKDGAYSIVIRYVGYTTDTVDARVSGSNTYIGNIKLKSSNRELEGAVVNASLNESEIDKEEVLVTNKMRTGVGTAREVLEKVNGVSYDRYKDAIKVDNNTNIIILVNGLEKNQEYVKNLDPERIAKIEVLRDPSGRYGLEGYSAVINVVLKQNYQGQEVFASTNNIFDTRIPSVAPVLPIQDYDLSYNYARRNLNLYSRVSTSYHQFELQHKEEIKYTNGIEIKQLPFDDNMNLKIKEQSYNLTLGGDYQISAKHIVSMEINANYAPLSPTDMQYNYILSKDTVNLSALYETNMEVQSQGFSSSAFYLGNYSDKKTLKADATYGMGSSQSNSIFGFVDTAKVVNSQTSDFSYFNGNVEWNEVLSKRFSWQLGYGIKWKESNNNSVLTDTTTSFLNSEFRNKAFAYGIWKLHKDVKMKFGLGVENYHSVLGTNQRNFWIYKPHFDLFYKPSQVFNIKLKYRAESQYPSISQTDPTEVRSDYFIVHKGNPNIEPTVIHTASLKLNVMGGLLSVEPYYQFSKNYIAPVGYLRSDGIFEYTYGNLGDYQNQGMKINLTVPFGQSVVWQNSLDLYKTKMSYQEIKNELNDWSGESQLLYVNQKSGLVAGLLYQRSNNKVLSLQGYENQENDFWGLMVQRPFFKKRFNVMMMMFLPIDFGANYEQVTYIETPSYNQTSTADIRVLKHLFLVKLTYRFHKGKAISTLEKDIEREQTEKKRSMF